MIDVFGGGERGMQYVFVVIRTDIINIIEVSNMISITGVYQTVIYGYSPPNELVDIAFL